MKARRIKVKCTYDNVDISRDIAAFLKSFSVREVLGGEADSAEITLEDREDSQKKLNAITSLPEGMKVDAFIGEEKDFNGADIDNGYFCYPIMYQGEKQVVFCRARRDVNSNKIYVHEVWTEDEIKGIPLQTAAKFSNSKPHGGNPLYTSILADFLNKGNECSKIVDENGEPLVVYHGTPLGGFDTFKRQQNYFTSMKWYADRYQDESASSNYIPDKHESPATKMTYAVFLNIKKLFDTRNKKERGIFEKEFYRQWG